MKLIKNALTPPLAAISALFAFALSASAAFNYKSEMTVQGYSGSSTLTNFPVLVRLSPERISGFTYARCQPDGKDIQFTSTDGETVYPHEIDTWDTTGESLVWVNIPRLSGTDTAFTFWFGDPELESGPSSAGAWAAANEGFYAVVYHFGEEIDAAAAPTTVSHDSAKHSSAVVCDAEPVGGKAATLNDMISRTGAIGRGRVNCNSTTQYGNGFQCVPYYGRSFGFGITDTFTFSSWLNIGGKVHAYYLAHGLYAYGIQKQNSLTPNGLDIYGGTSNPSPTHFKPTNVLPDVFNEWFQLTVVFEGTNVTCYTNGVWAAAGTMGNAATDSGYTAASLGFYLGNTRGAGHYSYHGSFDETRVLSNVATPDWIKADYETSTKTDYIAYGAASKTTGSDSLTITATPELFCADRIVPTYGTLTEFSGPIAFSAPDEDVALSDVLHVSFRGWELQRLNDQDQWVTIDSATTNQYVYVHENGCNDKFIWKIVRRYPLNLSVYPTESGSFLVNGAPTAVGTHWIDENAGALSISPVAAHGFDFSWWSGSRYGQTNLTLSVSVAPGVVTSVEASFLSNGEGHTPVTVGWGGGSGSWLDGANWVGGIVPQKGDTVLLTNATTKTITLPDPLPRFAKLVITNSTLIVSNWLSRIAADEIVIGSGGTIKLPGWFRNDTMSNRVWLVGNTLTVASGGKILADEAGYQGNNGPCWSGITSTSRDACGVYGGAYGGGSVQNPPHPYGSVREPEQPGSGPGTGLAATDANVGAGGGAIRLDFTGGVTIDGRVSANGRSNENSVYGSGGAIWITCRTIAGTGVVDASSRASAVTKVQTGGGGRLAVHYNPAAQSNTLCKVVFTAGGGPAFDFAGYNSFSPGETVLFHDYGRSAEDLVFATDPGSLFFTDNQFLFSSVYREMGLPFAGAWHSDEPLGKIVFDGDVALTNSCLQFLTPHEVVFNGNLSIVGSGYYARRWFGLIFGDSDVTVNGNLTLEGARLEMRGGALKVAGNVEQLSLVNNARSGMSAYTSRFAGGELSLKASPTNAPATYGAILDVAKTWHMAPRAVTAVFANPTNGAIVKLTAKHLDLDEGATIDAAEKGWSMNYGPGRGLGTPTGQTGSSYGGRGGTLNAIGIPPEPYGSEQEPVDPGSGGLSGHTHAGYDGGGVVMLEVARRFAFNGTITADGNTCLAGTYAYGSSGGTVNIRVGRLTGTTGKIRAQGGFCGPSGKNSYGKTGGGGRIAVRYGATDWTQAMKDAATCVLPGGASGDVTNNFGAEPGTTYWGTLAIGTMLIVK